MCSDAQFKTHLQATSFSFFRSFLDLLFLLRFVLCLGSSSMETPRKVIAAVDATEVSAYAFTWALHNLIRKGDHVIVLTVAPYVGLDYPNYDLTGEYAIPIVTSTSSTEESVVEEKVMTEESSALVSKFLQQCAQAEISCEGEVVKGEPGSWIVDEAARISADIIVVGSHAHGVIKRTILGSISDFVLHNAQCSVAIVRHSEALEVHDPLLSSSLARKIVVAVDDSKEAMHAFTWSLKNFCTPSDKVIIYHVRHPVVTPVTALGTGEFGMEDVYIPSGGNLKEDVDALDESEKLVERYMEYATNEAKIQCEGKVVSGPTEFKVCEGLMSLKADAVIVGTHGRGAIARTFLGSVSDYLSHNSPCPLIVVKMPKELAHSYQAEHAHLT